MSDEIMNVEVESTEMAVPELGVTMTQRQVLQCSFDTTTEVGKAKAYNAQIAPDYKVEDYIGEDIAMTGYLVEQIVLLNEETGELEPRMHSVIFDADGHTYESQSKGIVSSLAALATQYDFANRENPLDIQFIERKARLGRMYSIKVIA